MIAIKHTGTHKQREREREREREKERDKQIQRKIGRERDLGGDEAREPISRGFVWRGWGGGGCDCKRELTCKT